MRYKIILVPIPSDDAAGSKARPAVCLTEPIGAQRHVIIAFISSVVPRKLEPTDLMLVPNSPEFARTGLRVGSVLRLDRITTVPASIIQRQLGVLPISLQVQVRQRLRALFAT